MFLFRLEVSLVLQQLVEGEVQILKFVVLSEKSEQFSEAHGLQFVPADVDFNEVGRLLQVLAKDDKTVLDQVRSHKS